MLREGADPTKIRVDYMGYREQLTFGEGPVEAMIELDLTP
jgi:hypothetical protein